MFNVVCACMYSGIVKINKYLENKILQKYSYVFNPIGNWLSEVKWFWAPDFKWNPRRRWKDSLADVFFSSGVNPAPLGSVAGVPDPAAASPALLGLCVGLARADEHASPRPPNKAGGWEAEGGGVCVAGTNHWWGSECLKLWELTLGSPPCRPYKWRPLCFLMDGAQQHGGELCVHGEDGSE